VFHLLLKTGRGSYLQQQPLLPLLPLPWLSRTMESQPSQLHVDVSLLRLQA
jgi:hypothetical protein